MEDVLEIIHREKPLGVIVQFGGQTPLKLAKDLEASGVNILGTKPEFIDLAEDRERFQKLLKKLDLLQPPNRIARTEEEATMFARELGFPLLVRPSYVLGGRAMEIVQDEKDLKQYFLEAVKVSNESPVLLDCFLNDAIEVDVDCLFDGKDLFIGGIMEHIERAGVHSGDSACCIPPFSLDKKIIAQIEQQTSILAQALQVKGLMNIQYAVQNGDVYVLEVNPRASRTIPFASKATGFPIAKVAAKLAVGYCLDELVNEVTGGNIPASFEPTIDYVVTKIPRFAFEKFPLAEDKLTTQMKSVGEVMAIGRTFQESFQKALRGLETGINGLSELSLQQDDLKNQLTQPSSTRILAVGNAFRENFTVEEVYFATKIDKWFLNQIRELIFYRANLSKKSPSI